MRDVWLFFLLWIESMIEDRRVWKISGRVEVGSVLESVEVEEARRLTTIYNRERNVLYTHSRSCKCSDSNCMSLLLF